MGALTLSTLNLIYEAVRIDLNQFGDEIGRPSCRSRRSGWNRRRCFSDSFKLTLGAGELDLKKLNPANGWKKLIPSTNTLTLLGTSFSKIGVLGLAMYFEAQKAIQSPIFTSSMSIGDLFIFITKIAMSMLYKFMIIMVFFAIH